MTRQERLLRLARLRGDRAAELILMPERECIVPHVLRASFGLAPLGPHKHRDTQWTEAELRAAWGDR